MRLLILAGGFGTRLRELIPDRPKPLALISGRPFLGYLLEQWQSVGISNFTFLLHFQADQIIRFLESNQSGLLKESSLTTIVEPDPLGTGGSIANAIRLKSLQEPFLVANADTWVKINIAELSKATPPAIGVIKVSNIQRFGAVNLDESGVVVGFTEKGSTQGLGLINAGVYHLTPELFSDWNGEAFSLEQVLFPDMARQRLLSAVPMHGDFIDIGVPEDYHRFCRWVETGRSFPL